jgi:hypothetical protein
MTVSSTGLIPSPSRQPAVSATNMRALLADLSRANAGGRRLVQSDRLAAIRRLIEAGGVRTLELLLPIALSLNNKPYTLERYFPFSPVFGASLPSNVLLKTGRQVSKTTSLAAHGVLLANCIPDFKTLYVTPLYEQIRRFSNNYVRPFIDRSPLKGNWTSTATENSVLQRTFRNYSSMIFSFALLDADRIRGVPADKIAIDEVQDMDPDHIPIIRECMSASDWALAQFTGTPKTKDNPIEGLWLQSSQAEWLIKCHHGGCGLWNVPSLDFHLDKMLGPAHDFIGDKCPAVVCANCQKPLNPWAYPRGNGRWVHRRPELRDLFPGYHVPQIILPLHFTRLDKWRLLLAKRSGWGNTPLNVFYNEVMGESVDTGQKLVSETELQAAGDLGWRNNPERPDREIARRLPHYQMRVMGVDWGGGGEQGVSFTTLAVMGYTPTGKIEVLWGKRLLTPNDHMREAMEIRHWMNLFGCQLLAHDYTGAGIVRETVLVQAGMDQDRIMPIQYVRAASKNLLTVVPPTVLHQRLHYRADKTRTLLYTCEAIKLKLIRFFKYDYVSEDERGLMSDFLALVSEKTETRLAGEIYTITRNPMRTDDFAHSVNLGAVALWHANSAWPNFAEAANIGRITSSQIMALGNCDFGWEQDPEMRAFFNQP